MKIKVLKAIIQDGPITAKRLSLMCDIGTMEDRTYSRIRMIVNDLTEDGWPIASTNQGFFIAKSLRDRRKYKQRLLKHLIGTRKRISKFEEAYQQFKNKNIRHYLLLAKKPKRKIKRRKL